MHEAIAALEYSCAPDNMLIIVTSTLGLIYQVQTSLFIMSVEV